MNRIHAALVALVALLAVASGPAPVSARRMAPAQMPPDTAMARLAERAAQTSGPDLRACDVNLHRRARRINSVRFRYRASRGSIVVSSEQVGGPAAYRECLERTFAQHMANAATNTRIRVPSRSRTARREVTIPPQGSAQPVVQQPTQPAPVPPRQRQAVRVPGTHAAYYPVFEERGRFIIRQVNLEGQGAILHAARGGVVNGTLNLEHNCPGCGGAINQVIIGVAGDNNAQSCVYNGGANNGGRRQVNFQVGVPDRPGVYEIRARYAQAYNCRRALGWWQVDRPNGPQAESTIGVVIVGQQQQPQVQNGNELLINGSFEQPTMRRGQYQIVSSIPGWQRSAGRGIEVQHRAAGEPLHGNNLVELDGHDATSIYQDVRTRVGQTYALRVGFSARPGTAAADNVVDIYVDGALMARLQADGSNRRQTRWQYHTVYVQARHANSRIELRYAGTASGLGGYIDDLSFQPMP